MKPSLQRLVWSRAARIGASAALGGLLVYIAARDLDLLEVRRALGSARWQLVVLAVLSVAVNTMAKVLRWRVLLGQGGRDIAFASLLSSLLVGQMLNAVLPARLGDLSRSYTVGSRGPGGAYTLGTVVLEKLCDLVAYSLVVVCVLLLMPLPGWFRRPAYLIVASSLLLALVAVFVAHVRPSRASFWDGWLPLSEGIQTKLKTWISAALRSLSVLAHRGDLAMVMMWTAVIWATAVLNNHLAALALGIQIPLAASLLLVVVLQAGISIGTVPASIGVFEYLCVLTLAIFAVQRTPAFTYGVLLHLIVMLPTFLVGALLMPRSWVTRRHVVAPVTPNPERR